MPVNNYPFTYTASTGDKITMKSASSLTVGFMRKLIAMENDLVSASILLVDEMVNPKDKTKVDKLPFSELQQMTEAWKSSEAQNDLPKS